MEFKKTFTHGYLKGTLHTDTLSFVDIPTAERWARGVNANNKHGDVNYKVKVISYSVQQQNNGETPCNY
jgi:hypothetical protein